MSEHIVKVYDDELRELNAMVCKMGQEVRDILCDSIKLLVHFNEDFANQIIAADKSIDKLEMEIDEQATRLLALRQPMAQDLRTIVAALKISNDMERMGDYAKNIARRAKTISEELSLEKMGRSVKRMSKLVEEMIDMMMEAFTNRDANQAMDVIRFDEEVDEAYNSLFREILTYMAEDHKYISAGTHFMFIAKNIERMGDHATNVAEQIYYVVKGHQYEDGHTNFDKSAKTILS